MAPFRACAALALAAALAAPVKGNAFLGAHPHSAGHSMTQEIVKQALSTEVAQLASERTRSLEEELRPLFASLPKNERGNLEASSVRYALHRFFTKKHGWSIKGLDRAGHGWNASSPTAGVLKEQVSGYLLKLMEERVHGHGLNLEELAVFAATLDDLILGEVRIDIAHIYENLQLPMSGREATPKDEAAVMGRFLIAYISGYHEENGNYAEMKREVEGTYFGWTSVEMFARDQQFVSDLQRQRRRPFSSGLSFDDQVDVAQDFVRHFMTYQHTDCNALKNKLLDMEIQGSGRVRLADFYSGRRRSDWTFLESVEYLRAVGALDESIAGKPSVIIPNYLTSPSNCLSPSEYYNVCCRDECETMMAEIEGQIGQPSALPGNIVQIVSNLASDTVDAPRTLSTAQLERLQEIAEHHAGQVPLHGRLFAQWMHHAYPRECPFPHVSGTTVSATQEEWEEQGKVAEATEEEMRWHAKQPQWSETEVIGDLLPWHVHEELVSLHKHTAKTAGGWSSLRVGFFFMSGVSALVPLLRGAMGLKTVGFAPGLADNKLERHLV